MNTFRRFHPARASCHQVLFSSHLHQFGTNRPPVPNSTRVRNSTVAVDINIRTVSCQQHSAESPAYLCVPHFHNLAGVCLQSIHPQPVPMGPPRAHSENTQMRAARTKGGAWNATIVKSDQSFSVKWMLSEFRCLVTHMREKGSPPVWNGCACDLPSEKCEVNTSSHLVNSYLQRIKNY